uniref:Aspartyl/asparaginy/proline hydroxylase domain-containing protein n=1 Tax=Phaeomonas parva TaxID=124430 RepID=A0A7S1XSD5_9STRA|mmetsp:Transcript_28972/g.92647  ORF Transcript_28972/g.92647 Transcript_28972/m.92647 type:complete len:578 (+) Transcript_28972:57-1790(+)|eukprot:CAMPEP_0118855556 /NCGR_PEP_ID=MMETSP1163-20130328/3333_1 /TAXON_ID=124430 /ORGANISM="Phaeomonas parva, Strain CCMP2877" /LENGTH=577 /DNA_ID=CAMNT_0006788465 /DNA_START=84 /DNA_END=1817 /DNA_ORIENTATION=-
MAAVVEAADRPTFGAGQPELEKFRLKWDLLDETAAAAPPGAVRYDDKAAPIHELGEAAVAAEAAPFIFTRGEADVSGILEKLEAGGDEIWSEAVAREGNVHIDRPSHDSWGIRKIIFCFADDFLQRCFRLPLWRDPEWRALLDPVFEAAGVAPERVVRCLLASMPPRTVIPTHHDTGYWVRHTHRLHCAVKTNGGVVFRVGPREDALTRWGLAPGKVVELNNQAKHFVTNFGDEFRTHLIFDYVDEAAPAELRFPRMPEVRLEVGDELRQTRRSIDLRREAGTGPSAPHFLIIGAQKAGTTSMYEYLAQHPMVIRGRRRETHFLDWRWREELEGRPGRQLEWWARFYDEEAHHRYPSLRAGDSTPSYLLAPHLAVPRLRAMLEHGRRRMPLIVLLRDPAKRAVSHYRMVTDPSGTPAQKRTRGTAWLESDLSTLVEDDIAALAAAGVDRGVRAAEVDWDRFQSQYLEKMPNNHGSHSLVLRGLYALQLRPWIEAFGRDAFVFVRCEDLTTAEGVQAEVDRCVRHIGLRPHKLDNTKASNTRSYDRTPGPAEARLREYYEPFNQELYELLGWGEDKWW